MNYVGKLFSNVKGFYNEINSATLTGALDVIVLELPDGSYQSSPFHVRFGKLGVLRAREKVVDIWCNDEPVEDLQMKLGEAGEAFFVEETEEEYEVPAYLATSPLPSTIDLMEEGIQAMKQEVEQQETRIDIEPIEESSEPVTPVVENVPDISGSSAPVTFSLGPDTVQTFSKESFSPIKQRHRSENDLHIDDGRDYSEVFELDLSDEGIREMQQLPTIPTKDPERWQFESNPLELTHAFSDTDLTPHASPVGSRPESPKSDTEYENLRLDDTHPITDDLHWQWGELPERKRSVSSVNIGSLEEKGAVSPLEDKTSGGLFNFMKTTKKIRHQPEKEGIYLSDLNLDEMDPEIASLYLYKGTTNRLRPIKDEDSESGQGASLPQSPVSMDNEPRLFSPSITKPDTFPYDVRMSLCGGLSESEHNINTDKFMQDLVTYDDYLGNPDVLSNPNLVVCIGDKYYNWAAAAPMIMSAAVFQRPLPDFAVEKLVKQHMPKKQKRSGWRIWWGGSGNKEDAEGKKTEEADAADKPIITTTPPSSVPSSPPDTPLKNRVRKDKSERRRHVSKGYDASADEDSDDSQDKRISSKTVESLPRPVESNIMVDTEGTQTTKYRKTIRLSSEQVKKLNLRPGMNEVTFAVTTQYQGTTKCQSYVFLWKWDDRIIVSDIDGTITRSDVLGQLLPMVGKDWSQAGIANLYSMIAKNGYKFVYLSARAIGQSKITRDYLRSIKQGDDCLPEGPLMLSPSSLITAFHKEVIERKPEEFKISCLRDVAALFPGSKNPFYAGFGNKVNDVWAYRAVSIPISRIFTVNPRGELKLEQMHAFQSSYDKLSDIVDHFFPPLVEKPHKNTEGKMPTGDMHADEFSTFTYWRDNLPDITAELESLDTSDKR